MSKICQCKQDTLHALVLGTATGAGEYTDDDELDEFAYEQNEAIVKLLESDCVCFSYCESDHDHHKYKCIPRPGWDKKVEKQSHPSENKCELHFYQTEDGYCAKGCGFKFPDGYSPEGKQPDCDHIVGFEPNEDSITIPIKHSQLFNGKEGYIYDPTYDYFLKHCPECGEKLNLKKDE